MTDDQWSRFHPMPGSADDRPPAARPKPAHGDARNPEVSEYLERRLDGVSGKRLTRYLAVATLMAGGLAAGVLAVRSRGDDRTAVTATESRDGDARSITISDDNDVLTADYAAAAGISDAVVIRSSSDPSASQDAETETSCVDVSVRMDNGSSLPLGRFRRASAASGISYKRVKDPRTCDVPSTADTQEIDIIHLPSATLTPASDRTLNVIVNWVGGYDAPFNVDLGKRSGSWNPTKMEIQSTPEDGREFCIRLKILNDPRFGPSELITRSGLVLEPYGSNPDDRLTVPEDKSATCGTNSGTVTTTHLLRNQDLSR